MKKYKYNIGDVIILKNTNLGKIGLIIDKPEVRDIVYNILVCGDSEPVLFWEDEIDGKLE